MTDATVRCPWCSAPMPPGAHESCPTCGATLTGPAGGDLATMIAEAFAHLAEAFAED